MCGRILPSRFQRPSHSVVVCFPVEYSSQIIVALPFHSLPFHSLYSYSRCSVILNSWKRYCSFVRLISVCKHYHPLEDISHAFSHLISSLWPSDGRHLAVCFYGHWIPMGRYLDLPPIFTPRSTIHISSSQVRRKLFSAKSFFFGEL